MIKNEKRQIFILFLAVLFLCLSVAIAIMVRLMVNDSDSQKSTRIEISEDAIAYSDVIDISRFGGRALYDTNLVVEPSGVSRVGYLDNDNADDKDDTAEEEDASIIDIISDTAADALEGAKDGEVIDFIAAVEEDDAQALTDAADSDDSGIDMIDATAFDIEDAEAPSPELVEIDISSLPSDNSVVLGSSVSFTQNGVIDWNRAVMADVDKYLNVRTEPDKDAPLAGKMEKGDVGTVIEVTGDWIHMVSGDLEGYMDAAYSVLYEDAKEYAEEVCDMVATTTTPGLRIRKGPSTDDGIIRSVQKGYKLVLADDDDVDVEYDDTEWVAVRSGNGIGFVAKEYVTLSWDLGQGMTKEEEEAIQREKEEAAKRGKASTNTDDLILLAALIQGEGNGQPYEGKVAIANVVLNRVNSGGYPNTIYNVIYQPGQFGPAGSGKVAQIVLHGPSQSNIDAAAAALGGQNYIGGLTHFKSIYSGMQGAVIGGHVFY